VFNELLRLATRRGLTRGFGGSRAWMAVGATAVGIRMLRRLAHSQPEVLYRTVVKPGDAFELITRRPK
jgi:hypothetical protein